MTFPKELKEAISHLPSSEKDKLILRLLKKDRLLTERLLFELVSEQTADQRRDEVKQKLEEGIKRATKNFRSADYLNVEIRSMSGIISEHVFITKDKFGEAWLNLWMLNQILKLNKGNLSGQRRQEKFSIAVIARVFKVLLIINKLHEDFFSEFSDELKELGTLIGNSQHLMATAKHHGLDVNWLTLGNVPENIAEIYREIRKNGFLK
ncbi:hypothetical protein [Chryseobacterium sp.]|uniref:hypothetical protein n=1 Tax=Chryseobacterium sp. TaxID=1871047 RepID=UPI0011C7D78F|nr:hypothetical protein [Chryseobacterium sp.]TXF76009.1 hypothetical protein FUA25_08915 [Chryseobacterium sp.]